VTIKQKIKTERARHEHRVSMRARPAAAAETEPVPRSVASSRALSPD